MRYFITRSGKELWKDLVRRQGRTDADIALEQVLSTILKDRKGVEDSYIMSRYSGYVSPDVIENILNKLEWAGFVYTLPAGEEPDEVMILGSYTEPMTKVIGPISLDSRSTLRQHPIGPPGSMVDIRNLPTPTIEELEAKGISEN